jgi:hypothetical protein
VLDGGYPSTAPLMMASIALGFNIKDAVLLNSEPHPGPRRRAGGAPAGVRYMRVTATVAAA